MSSKGPWEKRMGMLLDSRQHSDFVYSFKPVDTGFYGGQTRIDWLACDIQGRFWMIEVKQVVPPALSFNVELHVSAGQRDALNAVVEADAGIALLAVGCGNSLYVFNWRQVRWQREQQTGAHPERVVFSEAPITLQWTGPKKWTHNLYALIGEDRGPAFLRMPLSPASSSPDTAPSAWISKQPASTRTTKKMQRLALLSSVQATRTLS